MVEDNTQLQGGNKFGKDAASIHSQLNKLRIPRVAHSRGAQRLSGVPLRSEHPIAGSTARLLQEANQRLDAQLEVLQMELLVRGVDVVVGQTEAHHHTGRAQVTIEVADDGDRPAGADKVRIPVKWAPDSGDAGRRRSEATLVESYSIQVAHMSQEKGK
jgi:hypothetical protein